MAAKHKKLTEQELKELLERNRVEELLHRFNETDPADAADLIEELDSDNQDKVFSLLDPEVASEVIMEMDPEDVDDVVESLSPGQLAGMVREMAPDDAADFFGELDKQEQTSVLRLLNEQEKRRFGALLNYPEDTGGGIMTPEICAVPADATVKEAIQKLINADFSDPISVIFVVDKDGKPAGSINVAELIAKPPASIISDVVNPIQVFARVDEDQEEIANDFRKYDLLVMPVVDEQGRLVGRITFDDVMDVMHEEASEDMARMAGAPDIEHNIDSPVRIVKMRLPWLIITMFTGIVVSWIIQRIIGLNIAACLAAFVPVILGMGGNTGMQASAVTVRSIALGEINMGKLMMIIAREIAVGAMMGTVCGLVIGIIVWINLQYFNVSGMNQPSIKLAVVVGVSMLTAMTFAAVAGTMMPIFLNQLKIDPAVASGPFVTTGNDLSASLIYLFMCYALLSV